MISVTKKVLIKVDADADAWGLYDLEDRELAAQNLSKYFERCVESNMTIGATYAAMEKHMQFYSEFGASDTEGYNTLDQLIDMAYGE